MKQIMKHCETCDGLGLVKIDSLGEIHSVEVEKVWNDEAEAYLKVTECICPDCLGLGEIDITEDYYLNEADDFIKAQKEK